MVRYPVGCVVLVLLLVTSCLSAEAPKTVRALDKKLIEYGWDVPFPDFIQDHIREMEQRPFDGLIFKLHGGGNVLTPTPWDEAAFAKDYETLGKIEWNQFTDNFVIMWAASNQDWFNDEHWRAIEHNVRLIAKAAQIGRCVGVCFDAEPYGNNPWDYGKAAHRQSKTFDDYQAIARRRGAVFMRAIQQELPKPQILTFFQVSFLTSLLAPMDPLEQAAKLSKHHYGLLPAFVNGMIEAAGPGTTIIDGNESAYYYTDRCQHLSAYHTITQRSLLLIDPALWDTYRARVRVGQALYIDQYFGLRPQKVLGHYMPPEDQARWFEYNAYWALTTTDRYVWCYSERMNWWKNEKIPSGGERALRSARTKVASGESLGFDISPVIEAASKRQHSDMQAKLRSKRRTAMITRLPTTATRPRIDGRLDDDAWQPIKPLEPFVGLACQREPLRAQTQARIAYDDRAVYIATRCREPTPKQMNAHGQEHDDDVWLGDDVEVMISAPGKLKPYYHFMVNPKGVAWDAVEDGSLDYNPTWERGVQIGADAWFAEMAIPWSAMKMAMPKPGEKLNANLARQRIPGGREWSSWSPMANGFLEPELFGTWEFR